MYNSLCSELDWWYKYVKENKGDKNDTCQLALILANIFKCLFVHQKKIHRNHRLGLRGPKKNCRL
jgi:hypothetical protein